MSFARTGEVVRRDGHRWGTTLINWALSRLERTDAWLTRRRTLSRQPVSPSRRAVAAGNGSSTPAASLVVLNWQRPDNVHAILDRYVTIAALDDILVWNNNGAVPFHYAHPKVRCINSDELGLSTRWLACLIAKHDCVIVHDDDLVCDDATIESLVHHHYREPDRSFTLHGRNPTTSNEYAEKVDHVAQPTECDVHLTRATCVNRRWVLRYFEALSAMQLDIDPARGGGEDIVFSYAVRAATGLRPMVVPGRYDDLIARRALANRNGSQAADRTRIMQTCQQWLARGPVDHTS